MPRSLESVTFPSCRGYPDGVPAARDEGYAGEGPTEGKDRLKILILLATKIGLYLTSTKVAGLCLSILVDSRVTQACGANVEVG